ncbi:MAG: ribonuclease III [Mariprofundaceae bacterium]|nr:ribonuclease III [Mariprofundaceae bacterium]
MPKRHSNTWKSYKDLEQRIDTHFTDVSLLKRALTHCSYDSEHMERLEFLGDAVLGLVIAEYLHDVFPKEAEGQLSRLRAALVRKESLYEVAQHWDLALYLRVGEGERSQHGVKSHSIVANAVEAVIGAVLKDAGWSAAKNLTLQSWQPLLEKMNVSDARDAKSRLQEYTQAKGWGLPEYKVQDLGISLVPRFEALCWVQHKQRGRGLGARKKIAELHAAEESLKIFEREFGAIE